jgi:hypothetical protein
MIADTPYMNRLNVADYIDPFPSDWPAGGGERSVIDPVLNVLHSTNGPALLRGEGGRGGVPKAYYSEWRTMGVLHRENGPARVFRQSWGTNGLFTIEYLQNGELHREDGPAWITVTPVGNVIEEKYCKHGFLHREDGPAWIKYDYFLAQQYNVEGAPVTSQEWYTHGVLHREDGPARTSRPLPCGEWERSEWYQHGIRFNPDGAVLVERYRNGQIEYEIYYDEHGEYEIYYDEHGERLRAVEHYIG